MRLPSGRGALSLIVVLLAPLGAVTGRLEAQSGQVEVWIPLTTRAAVVDALTRRLDRDHWNAVGVSDYGVRFERPGAQAIDAMGRPAAEPTVERLRITFRDLADTLRVAGSLATVTHASTATERVVNRDDPASVRQVAELLAEIKGVTENRRVGAEAGLVGEAAPMTPPPVPVAMPAMNPPSRLTVARKEPVLAFVLSLLIPGAGQGYNGQWGKGAVMFTGAVVGAALVLHDYSDGYDYYCCTSSSSSRVGALMLVGSVLWSVIDAPIAATRINHRAGLAFRPGIVPLRASRTGPVVGIRLGEVVF